MSRALDLVTSYAASVARLGAGLAVGPLGRRPEKLLELYEFEGCPFCRKVREALSMLDLDALVQPCPKGGERFRKHAIERGGKKQFPWLVDPNTGREMYESDDIVRYLYAQYGDGGVPWYFALPPLTMATLVAGSVWRPMAGVWARPSRVPEQPLELWSFEASPYCRLVRERLCELELPYVLHNVAKGSPKRAAFVARSGKMQVPYLLDPNTGRALFESADIVSYLEETYALAADAATPARTAAAGTGA
ncbi:MAG: glutathione S-transferase N-terminal domain-containing protein [Thermodesulfobacteriota bacterium]